MMKTLLKYNIQEHPSSKQWYHKKNKHFPVRSENNTTYQMPSGENKQLIHFSQLFFFFFKPLFNIDFIGLIYHKMSFKILIIKMHNYIYLVG